MVSFDSLFFEKQMYCTTHSPDVALSTNSETLNDHVDV